MTWEVPKRSLIIFFIMGIGLVCTNRHGYRAGEAWSAAGPASGDAGEPRIISSRRRRTCKILPAKMLF